MSIKPIDFQVMIPKTSEVSKTVNDNHQKNLSMNQNNAENLQHKAESEVKTVHSKEKASGPQIRDHKEKKNKKESKKYKDKDKDKDKNSTIDIRL
ncbi:MAG TPA: hypothetical protein VIO64_05015 [Pseudobacteroides sp.]|uniref:hypothetical protein n=1 Tax=Pseudobacteroides sp. TaxID=1968840 RepID=UPI002F9471A7